MKSKKQKINSKTRKRVAKRKNIRKTIRGAGLFGDNEAKIANAKNAAIRATTRPQTLPPSRNEDWINFTKIPVGNINEGDMRHFIVKLNGRVIDLGPRLYDVVQSNGTGPGGCKKYFRYITYLKETFEIRGEKPNKISCADYTGHAEVYYTNLINSGEWYFYDLDKVRNINMFAN